MQKILLQKFFKGLQSEIPFEVRYWDQTNEQYGQGEAKFRLTFDEKVPVTRFLKEPSLTFGESYMEGNIHIDGKIDDVIRLAFSNRSELWNRAAAYIPKIISPLKQKKDVQHHYDLGNDFYSLWLDESMSYSCAYFRSEEDSLHQAQLQKIDHVLKKLQLKKGETLLDIGSGWGWLIIRAAQKYGVQAYGITLSEEQYKKTKERIESLGLTGQVNVWLADYRDLPRKNLSFDKIASVGMFEHVGQANYPTFMETIQSLLKNQGVALLHTITHQKEEPVDPWIDRYIFPGGYIPSLREIFTLLPEYDFQVIDVESLRLHYAKTLDHWAERFEAQVEKVKEMYGERFVRMWRLYLQSSAAFFRSGGLNIHQMLFTNGINNNLEMTRDFLYRP